MKLGDVIHYKGPATYIIIDPDTSKRYIGSTRNAKQRMHQHLTALRNHCHKNVNLSKIYDNNFGNFDLVIYEMSTFEEAFELENKLLDWYKDTTLLLNIIQSNGRHAEETKNKIAQTLTGRLLSEENKRKLSLSRMGIVFSKEHCNNISLGKKNPVTINGVEYINHAIAARDLQVPVDRIPSLSKGIEVRPNPRKVSVNGIVFNSLVEARTAIGLTKKQLERRLDSHHEKYKDFYRL